MRRDKKAAQKKKARAVVRRSAQGSTPKSSRAALLRLARTSDFGPAFLSPEWREGHLPPELVSVLVTRTLPGGLFAIHSMLVDRTCLGVKNAFSLAPLSASDLDELIARIGTAHGEDLDRVEPAVAQSVVFHAVAYAAELGFEPHPDFDPGMLEPRPDALEDTPLARRERPLYVPGPDDDVPRILSKLEAAVGPQGFDVGDPDEDLDDE